MRSLPRDSPEIQSGHTNLITLVNCLRAQLLVIHVDTRSTSCPSHHTRVCALLSPHQNTLLARSHRPRFVQALTR